MSRFSIGRMEWSALVSKLRWRYRVVVSAAFFLEGISWLVTCWYGPAQIVSFFSTNHAWRRLTLLMSATCYTRSNANMCMLLYIFMFVVLQIALMSNSFSLITSDDNIMWYIITSLQTKNSTWWHNTFLILQMLCTFGIWLSVHK